MNSVSLIGRLVREPKVGYGAQSQKAVARFTLAVDKNFKKSKDDPANFISVVCFGKTAEFVEKYAQKGKRVAIYNGEIVTGSYEKDGQMVYTTDVVAGNVEIIDWPDKDGQRGTREPERPSQEPTQLDGFAKLDEEVPF